MSGLLGHAGLLMAAGPPFDPATLFALGEVGGWWDPSDSTTVFQDAAATTPAAIGDPVGCIRDKSPNGLHLTQSTAAARPTLLQDGSGKIYLSRDGVDDYMESAATLSLEATWTLVYAGQYASGSDSAVRALLSLALNSTNYFLVGVRQDVASARGSCRADATGDPVVTASGTNGVFTAGANHVLSAYMDGTTVAVATDANAYQTGALASTYGPVASSRIRLGLQTGLALAIASRWYGGVALKRAMTADERAGLRSYLNGKM